MSSIQQSCRTVGNYQLLANGLYVTLILLQSVPYYSSLPSEDTCTQTDVTQLYLRHAKAENCLIIHYPKEVKRFFFLVLI